MSKTMPKTAAHCFAYTAFSFFRQMIKIRTSEYKSSSIKTFLLESTFGRTNEVFATVLRLGAFKVGRAIYFC